MTPQPIQIQELPANNDTYSQAVRLGDLVYVSGQLGVLVGSGLLSGFSAQTRQAIENVSTVLRAAGSDLSRVVKVNIFVTDFSRLAEMNEVYREYFKHRPAKTTVQVARLDQDAMIEIEVIAAAR